MPDGELSLFSAHGAGRQLLTRVCRETFTAQAEEREIRQAGSLDPAKEIVDFKPGE